MIVLLTDFGEKDPFAGIMKGVILGIHPALSVVDLTHGISPHDIGEAAFVLRTSIPYFPKAALFVIVVDPGVGGKRKIIYVETEKHRFLAPDNGVLGMTMEEEAPLKVIHVSNPRYFLKPISDTFHGRDIFAPVAAYLATGLYPEELGPPLDPEKLIRSPFPKAQQDQEGNWHGQVVYIDHFGNLITNLWQSVLQLKDGEPVEVCVKGEIFSGLAKSYTNHHKGAVVLLNSFKTVEIALNGKNAAKTLEVKKGDEVILRCPTCSS